MGHPVCGLSLNHTKKNNIVVCDVWPKLWSVRLKQKGRFVWLAWKSFEAWLYFFIFPWQVGTGWDSTFKIKEFNFRLLDEESWVLLYWHLVLMLLPTCALYIHCSIWNKFKCWKHCYVSRWKITDQKCIMFIFEKYIAPKCPKLNCYFEILWLNVLDILLELLQILENGRFYRN